MRCDVRCVQSGEIAVSDVDRETAERERTRLDAEAARINGETNADNADDGSERWTPSAPHSLVRATVACYEVLER